MSTLRKELLSVFECLLGHFGPRRWWPAQTPFEMTVGAILTQNTAWANVEKAVGNLAEVQALSPAALAALPLAVLEKLIRPSGYFRQKAERLQLFASFLLERCDGDVRRLFNGSLDDIRAELLARKGIGPETADSILLYAGHLPSFVVDAYTIRIFNRLGFFEDEKNYMRIRTFFMDHLPADSQLFNEYHALIVEHGKTFCKKRKPLCPDCPLRPRCPFSNHSDPTSGAVSQSAQNF